MITEFAKYWLQSTVAPESIKSVELTKNVIIHQITNEYKTKKVFVFEQLDINKIIAITDECNINQEDIKIKTFSETATILADKLELRKI